MGFKAKAAKPRFRAGLYVGQAVALLGMALLAYLPSFRAPFQYDDVGLIVENKFIQIQNLSLGNLARAGFQDFKQNRPVPNASLALNYYFGGLEPFGYHLVNFFILILTAAGIWLLLRQLLLRLGFDPVKSEIASWMTALLWVLHPINTQAVTYVIQRHTSLSGAFCIWSLFFFHLGAERVRAPRFFYTLSAISCALALLSKETALTLPLIIFAYQLYFFDGFKPGWIRRNWKWFVGLLVFYLAASAFALRPSMLERLSYYFGMMEFSAWQRFLTEFRALAWYPMLVLFPLPGWMSLVHEFPVSTSLLHPATTLVDMVLVLGLGIAALIWARQRKFFSFAVVWYFGLLLVEALPLPIELVHEHRLYLASLSIIATIVCVPVLKMKKISGALALLGLVALLFAGFTWGRNQIWRAGDSLWRDAIEKAPYSKLAGSTTARRCRWTRNATG
jgi:protein O-mannosyl-transferase